MQLRYINLFMQWEYFFLGSFIITSIILAVIFLKKDNVLIMLDLLKTGDPDKWMSSKYFKPILIFVLIATAFCMLFFWRYIENNGGL